MNCTLNLLSIRLSFAFQILIQVNIRLRVTDKIEEICFIKISDFERL